MRRFVGLARDVHRAMEIVVIEGPPAMVDAADRMQRASEELSEVVRRMAGDAHAADTARKAADETAAAERERALYRTITGFRAEARDTLGNSG